MAALSKQPLPLATALLVPLLSLLSPAWLKLAGVPPCWAVLWLLPWALVDGRQSAIAAGLGLGLLLDSLHPGAVTQIPGLMLLGWWWGHMGRQGPVIERSFNLGLLALCGTLLLNLSLMAQWALRDALNLRRIAELAPSPSNPLDLGLSAAMLNLPGWRWLDLTTAGLHILLAQTLITALLAPLLCSLQLLLWRQLHAGWRR